MRGWTYSYTGELLTTITDPTGETFELSYSGGLLDAIEDPAGRMTELMHDAQGDLVQIMDPDGSVRLFEYEGHRLVAQRSKRDFETLYYYDFAGRFSGAARPDGSMPLFEAQDVAALPDLTQGEGTAGSPMPRVKPEDVASTYTDGNGHSIERQLDSLGLLTSMVDRAGLLTTIDRDEDGNPVYLERPSGQAFTRSFDEQGNALTVTDEVLGGTTTYTYEPVFNRVTSITDDRGEITLFEYDTRGNLERTELPSGREMTSSYLPDGRIDTMTDFPGTQTRFVYDLDGNLEEIQRGSGADERVTTFTRSPTGAIDSVVDAEGHLTSFTHDELDRVTLAERDDQSGIAMSYDDGGNLESLTPPGKPAHSFGYDERGREASYTPPDVGFAPQTLTDYDGEGQPTIIERPDGRNITMSHDGAGRLQTVSLARGDYVTTYDPTTGRVSDITAPDGSTLSFGYLGDRVETMSWAGTVVGSVGMGYDSDGRVSSCEVNHSEIASYGYDGDGLLTAAGALSFTRDAVTGLIESASLGDVATGMTYNAFGELATGETLYQSTSLYAVSYDRDKLGRIVQKTETIEGTTTVTGYVYDDVGRLHEVLEDNVSVATYSYDDNGNRLNKVTPSGNVNGTYDDQDRLLSYGDFSYEYLESGELLSKTNTVSSDVTMYDYDELGNLLSVALPDNTLIDYEIDAQNRRVARRIDGVVTQRWLYKDQLNPVAELDSSNNVVSVFVYGAKRHVPEYMVQGGATYRIVSDHLGSVRLVVDVATGTVAQRLDYDEFGEVLVDSNPGFQPFGFAGGLYDPDTGLVRFGARDYDPLVGRWTAKDPILFDGDGPNLYQYANGDPINRFDSGGTDDSPVALQACLLIAEGIYHTCIAFGGDPGECSRGYQSRSANCYSRFGPEPDAPSEPEPPPPARPPGPECERICDCRHGTCECYDSCMASCGGGSNSSG